MVLFLSQWKHARAQTWCHLISCVWSAWISFGPRYFGDVMLGSAIKTLRLSVFSKGDLKVQQSMHFQHWAIILALNSSLQTLSVFFEWMWKALVCDNEFVPYCIKTAQGCTIHRGEKSNHQKKQHHHYRNMKSSLKSLLVFPQLYLPPSQIPRSWQDIQRHCAAQDLWVHPVAAQHACLITWATIQHKHLHLS